MRHTVFKRDFNHPIFRMKMQAARELKEINEFSTPEEISTIIARNFRANLERQLNLLKDER